MILFELKCSSDHRFDAWFRSNAEYEAREQGVIACPVCGDRNVVKAPMAPRILRSAKERAAAERSLIEREQAAAQAPQPQAAQTRPPDQPQAPLPPAAADALPVPYQRPEVPVSAEAQAALQAEAAQLLQRLAQLRQQVEEKCDYVGERFAEEARRIHYGESSPRDIYGEASADEAELLRDEGISVLSIPWLPRAN